MKCLSLVLAFSLCSQVDAQVYNIGGGVCTPNSCRFSRLGLCCHLGKDQSGRNIFATAGHCLDDCKRGTMKVQVNGEWHRLTAITWDKDGDEDYAILAADIDADIPVLPLASLPPQEGESGTVISLSTVLKPQAIRFGVYNVPFRRDWHCIDAPSLPGDSGGAILNADGEFVTVISGSPTGRLAGIMSWGCPLDEWQAALRSKGIILTTPKPVPEPVEQPQPDDSKKGGKNGEADSDPYSAADQSPGPPVPDDEQTAERKPGIIRRNASWLIPAAIGLATGGTGIGIASWWLSRRAQRKEVERQFAEALERQRQHAKPATTQQGSPDSQYIKQIVEQQTANRTRPEKEVIEKRCPFPRELDEARQLLRLRESEGRVATLDALRGMLLDDTLNAWLEGADEQQRAIAMRLMANLDQRVAEIAPISTRYQEQN